MHPALGSGHINLAYTETVENQRFQSAPCQQNLHAFSYAAPHNWNAVGGNDIGLPLNIRNSPSVSTIKRSLKKTFYFAPFNLSRATSDCPRLRFCQLTPTSCALQMLYVMLCYAMSAAVAKSLQHSRLSTCCSESATCVHLQGRNGSFIGQK